MKWRNNTFFGMMRQSDGCRAWTLACADQLFGHNHTLDVGSPFIGTATNLFYSEDGGDWYYQDDDYPEIAQVKGSCPAVLYSGAYHDWMDIDYNGDEGDFLHQPIVSPDGTVLMLLGGKGMTHWAMSTPFEVATAVYQASKSNAWNGPLYTGYSAQWISPDGLNIIMSDSSPALHRFEIPTAWDIQSESSPVSAESFDMTLYDLGNLWFSPDGLRMYSHSRPVGGDDYVDEFVMSSAFAISTLSYVDRHTLGLGNSPYGFAMSADGRNVYQTESYQMFQRQLLTAWDFTDYSATDGYIGEFFGVSTQDSDPIGLVFKDDSSSMYVVGQNTDRIHQYNLSPVGDVSTAVADGYFDAAGLHASNPVDVMFGNDGLYIYVLYSDNTIYRDDIFPAWDASGYSHPPVTPPNRSMGFADSDCVAMERHDADHYFVAGQGSGKIYKIASNEDWDLGLTNPVDEFSLGLTVDERVTDFKIKPDGSKMYVLISISDDAADDDAVVREYDLLTSWLPSSASLADTLCVQIAGSNASALAFTADGKKLCVLSKDETVIATWRLKL